jgi:protein-tyrosine phosphatase
VFTIEEESGEAFYSASWILDGKLLVGNFSAATSKEFLARLGVRSVVGLTDALAGKTAEELGVDRLVFRPMIDGAGNSLRLLQAMADEVRLCMESAPPVLVHCHAGRSRSVIVAAAYLVQCHGHSVTGALETIESRREIKVAQELGELLQSFYLAKKK